MRFISMDEERLARRPDQREILFELDDQEEEERFLLCANSTQLAEYTGDTMYNYSGQEVQRISVVNTLPELLKSHHAECLTRVVPKIREMLHVAEAEMQTAACAAFLQILQKQLMPVQSYTHTFLQSILTGLDSRHADIANAWLETLLDIIELLPKETIKKDVMNMAISRGQLSQPVQSRLACCRILGKIATKFEPFVIKKDILPVVQSLCQDVDYEVRGCMCRQLHSVARGLGLEQTKSAILPELVELTNDEESFVRRAGLDTTVSILAVLDEDTRVNTIVPLVCKFCQHALSSEDYTLSQVALQFGKLSHSLSSSLTEEQHKWFIDYYKKLCRLGVQTSKTSKELDPLAIAKLQTDLFPSIGVDFLEDDSMMRSCRQNAAHNFPAMTMFCGASHFKTELYSICKALCSDGCHLVRKTMASGLHEVIHILGHLAYLLLSDFVSLLNDSSIEVLAALLPNLPKVLATFHSVTPSLDVNPKSPCLLDVTPAILGCDRVIAASYQWRLQEQLVQQLACVPDCFHSDHVYQKYVPLLFAKLHTARALPVKIAAIKTILVCLRANHRQEQRNDMCQRLVTELGHSNNYYQRRLFVDVCRMALDTFSRDFVKTHLFEHVIALSADAVPNVRLRVCMLLPALRATMRLPADRVLLQPFETAVRKLLSHEKDRDVQVALDKAVAEMDRVPVQLDMVSKKTKAESDLIDMQREEEENNLLQLEEMEKKEEEARASRQDKKRDLSIKNISKIPAPKKTSSKSTLVPNKDRMHSGTTSNRPPNRMDALGTIQKELRKTPSFKATKPVTKPRIVETDAAGKASPGSTTSVPSRKSSVCSVGSSTKLGASGAHNGRPSLASGSAASGRSRRS